MDGDEGEIGGILVSVEPLQSSFFAGEPFSAKITFTNTRPVSISTSHSQYSSSGSVTKEGLNLPPRPATATGATFKHRRGAHSITYGSVPLANPPTSPGAPHYSFSSSTPSLHAPSTMGATSLSAPRGLIGLRAIEKGKSKQLDDISEVTANDLALMTSEQKRKFLSRRTLSVDMLPVHSSQRDRGETGPSEGSGNRVLKSPVTQRKHPPSPLSRSRSDSNGSENTQPTSQASTSTIAPSSLSRSPSLVMSRSHPHARKQSVIDLHALPQVIAQGGVTASPSRSSISSLSTSTSNPSILSPSPSIAINSAAFSLALDPINEFSQPTNASTDNLKSTSRNSSHTSLHSHSPSPTPIVPNNTQSDRVANGVRRNTLPSQSGQLGPPRRSSLSHTASPLGLGLPSTQSQPQGRTQSQGHLPTPQTTEPPHRSAHSSTFAPPNTEVLLWSYAQLLGTIEIDEATPGLVSHDSMAGLRSKLNTLKGGVIGGGRMDIGSVSPGMGNLGAGSRTRRGFISSFLGTTAPSPDPGDHLSPPSGTMRGLGLTTLTSALWGSPNVSPTSPQMSPFSVSGGQGLSSLTSGVSGGLSPLALPTLETQPSMLAVDLNLAPGESRTYMYTVELPDVLPPTFRGKAIKFSYHLVIGTSKATRFPVTPSPPVGGAGGISNSQRSKIMRFPIRVYNNVSVGRVSRPYDLLWPVARRRMGLIKCTAEEERSLAVINQRRLQSSTTKPDKPRGTRADFEAFARDLLSMPNDTEPLNDDESRSNTIRGPPSAGINGHDASSLHSRSRPNLDEDLDGLGGCRESVDILTRVSKKVSYDITKDNVKVAVLTFTKSAYRLGETVMAIVEMNEPDSRARVLRFSAMLETHESIPPSFAPPSTARKARGLRRIHGEHHVSLAVDTLRSTFTLDIPSDASPCFRMGLEDSEYEDIGGLEWKVKMCFLVAMGAEDGSGTKQLIRDGKTGEWGTSWRATPGLAPLSRGGGAVGSGAVYYRPSAAASSSSTSSAWSLFSSLALGDTSAATDPELAEEWDWSEAASETVECEVGVTVWPGNTLYKPTPSEFEA